MADKVKVVPDQPSRNEKVNSSLTNLDKSPYKRAQPESSISGANKSTYDTNSSMNKSINKGGMVTSIYLMIL